MKEIKVDHYVKTADGTLCKVTYIGRSHGIDVGMAELMPLEGGERLTLPVTELRRVPNPTNKRPAIENMPVERPRCAWCDRPLRPVIDNVFDGSEKLWKRVIVRRVFERWYAYEGVFHSTTCAIRLPARAIAAGSEGRKHRCRNSFL